MAIGKYRYDHTWETSKEFGPHEELLAEGDSAGSSWALVRRWYPNPQYAADRIEKYVFRINLSEWWNAYQKCFPEATNLMNDAFRRGTSVCGCVKCVGFGNRSPSFWNDGFGVSLYLEAVPFRYASEEDRFKSVVETGRDWDTLDYGEITRSLLERLKPVFDLFSNWGPTKKEYSF